jgi:hypothetical protein
MLPSSAPASVPPPASMLVQLSVGQLQRLVRRAIDDALAELDSRADAGPVLLDLEGLAAALRVTTRALFALRKEPGFPELRVGDAPRFRLEAVLAWLEARRAAKDRMAQSTDEREAPNP